MITLPTATGAGHTLIVGVSFWPLDITSVTDSSGDSFTRGIATSIYHDVSQGALYTNFYYARNTAGGATSITLHFSGGATYVVAAVSEVAGLDPGSPLDTSSYNESLTSASPWSSNWFETSAANEYLFSWAADEWNNPSCSNPTSGWTETQNTSGATVCLLDRTVTSTGWYQASVTPSSAFNYIMEMVGFKAAAQSISVVQRATLSEQPASSGAATISLPKAAGAGHALIVGVSFWPLDISSVTDSSGDSFTRGITTSIYHDVSQGALYTNFYYAKSTAGGATSITLHFSGGATYVVAAVSEVSGLDPNSPLDTSSYNESLTSASPWSSNWFETSAANEYLFSWAADEWNNPSCSNPTSGWTETQNTSGATVCLLDRTVTSTGWYQASVTPSSAFNYIMEMVGFKAAGSSSPPIAAPVSTPLAISTTGLPSGAMDTWYSTALAASGGVSPYTWSASGLPAGLAVSSSGTISGTPTVMGTATVSVTATDSSGNNASASFSLTINTPPLPAQPATTHSLLYFGNAGYGGDDTGVFQAALNYAAANGQALEIPAGSYNVSPLNLPANTYLIVDAGVTVSANSGYGADAVMLNINAGPVTISGAGSSTSVFQMPNARAASVSDGSQWRHCLEIGQGGAASNVTISQISCNQSGGDGIYIRNSTSVLVENCIFNGNFRDGGSITGAVNGVTLVNNYFTNTSGASPESGIDIEPNTSTDFLKNISLQNNFTNYNAANGVKISLQNLTSSSQPVGITVLNHHSTGNQLYNYLAINDTPSNPSGAILISNSFSDQSGSSGAMARYYVDNGESLTFQNLTVTNPHVNGPDPSYGDSAAVDIIRGGGGTVPLGNVFFTNINISVTNGMVSQYFNFEDYSNVGITNVEFVPGTLSGATQVPPNGLMQGQAYNSIN